LRVFLALLDTLLFSTPPINQSTTNPTLNARTTVQLARPLPAARRARRRPGVQAAALGVHGLLVRRCAAVLVALPRFDVVAVDFLATAFAWGGAPPFANQPLNNTNPPSTSPHQTNQP
jgi:hypothetical protein